MLFLVHRQGRQHQRGLEADGRDSKTWENGCIGAGYKDWDLAVREGYVALFKTYSQKIGARDFS